MDILNFFVTHWFFTLFLAGFILGALQVVFGHCDCEDE